MGEIQGIARFKIHDGKLEEWKRLVAEAMETIRSKDSGTWQYDIFLSDDSSEGVVYERYRDSVALLEHFANLGDTMNALLQRTAPSRARPSGCPARRCGRPWRVPTSESTLRTSRCRFAWRRRRLFLVFSKTRSGVADQILVGRRLAVVPRPGAVL